MNRNTRQSIFSDQCANCMHAKMCECVGHCNNGCSVRKNHKSGRFWQCPCKMKPTRAERKSGKCVNFMLHEVVEIPKDSLLFSQLVSTSSPESIIWGVKNGIVRVTEDDYMMGTLYSNADCAQYKERESKE